MYFGLDTVIWIWIHSKCGLSVFSGYTRGILWVCSQYTLGILWVYYGYTVGILWVYSEYTLGIPLEKKVSDEVEEGTWNVSISYPLIIAGLISPGFYGSYSVTKYGVEAFSDALRREMYPWGIKVSMLEPGSHTTNICAPDMFERQLKKGWNQLSDVVKDEYGEEYLRTGEFDDKPASYAEDSSLDKC